MLFKKAGAACLLGGVFVFASLSAQAEVFINEIHYDDADTPTTGDNNESLEIVATNGEDLNLYDIVLYNGSTPSSAVTYDTDAIPSGSTVACGSNVRIAVLSYPANGLQNGANDAIAIKPATCTLATSDRLPAGKYRPILRPPPSINY